MCVCMLLLNILTGFHYSDGIFGGHLFFFLYYHSCFLLILDLGTVLGNGTWYGTLKKIERILR